MTKKKTKKQTKNRVLNAQQKIPFIEHLYELRRRMAYVAVSMVFFGVGAYFIQQQLIAALLRPASGQQFIYTSPGGGINFLFQICIYAGIIMSVPVMVMQLIKYFEPLISKRSKRFIIRCGIFSIVLAMFGVAFGYFIGLPSALHFLARQFTTEQIQPLFTIQEYMSFVSIYLIGSAILFQIPLIMLFINRITPLKPMKLFKAERFVVLAAFIIAAFITPTPDIFNQVIIAGPIIVVYQLGICLVWFTNHRPKSKRRRLEERDAKLYAERQAKLSEAKAFPVPPLPGKPKVPFPAILPVDTPKPAAISTPTRPDPVIIRPTQSKEELLNNRYRRNRPLNRAQAAYKPRPAIRWNELSDIRPVRNLNQARPSY